MIINGLQKLTLLDYPSKTACIVFVNGCNFRCPFCHNASLVLGQNQEKISDENFFNFLNARHSVLEGVCITGGEPTLQPDLESFITKIKDLGFCVKLDTNGYRPDVLKNLCQKGLIDYIAMDIKNSPAKYSLTTGIKDIDIMKIKESASFLLSSNVDFEFRTTVVEEFHTKKDFQDIGSWLQSDSKYYLQAFRDNKNTIAQGLNSPSESTLNAYLTILQKYLPNAKLR